AVVAVADLLVGLVAIDLAPSGDRNRGQEGADAAARHQEARGLGQLVHGTPEEGGGLTGGPFDLAEGAEHVGAARAAHRGRKVGELRGRGDEANKGGDRLAKGFLVGEDVVVDLAAAGDVHAADQQGEVDDAAADGRAGVVIDLAAAAHG